MKTHIKIILRADYIKIDGSTPVYLRFTLNRKVRKYALGVSVLPKYWLPDKQRIKDNYYDSTRNNAKIDFYRNKAKQILWEYECVKLKNISFQEFEKAIFNEFSDNKSVYDFIREEIKKSKGKFSDDTLRTHGTQLTKLQKFRPVLLFSDIDLSFIQQYESYMINKLNNNHNTITKSLSFIKAIINKAILAGNIKENPFKYFPLSRIEGNREFLSITELEKLEILYFSDELEKQQKIVLNYFLFGCLTGLRFQDICNLRFKDIKQDVISIIMHKTKEPVRIPLIPRAKKLLKNDYLENEKLFKTYTNQATNRVLKEIMKQKGINKKISFHCARHTFATIGVSVGMPLDVISKLLGHTSTKPTLIYAKYTDTVKIEEMQKLN